MVRELAILLLCVAFALQISPSASQREYPVLKLRPAAFPELPKNLAAELDHRGCRVPQPDPKRRQNVIRGEFARPGQTDWAVLCSMDGFSRIVVFWKGSESDAVEIAKWQDPPPTVICDNFIRPVARKFIMDHYRAYGGPKPPPIDHLGIESGGEKASVVLYYYRGKWLELQGAD